MLALALKSAALSYVLSVVGAELRGRFRL
jgi:hypothetical protein